MHDMTLAGRTEDFRFQLDDYLKEGSWVDDDMLGVLSEYGDDDPSERCVITDEDRLLTEIETILERALQGSLSFSTDSRKKTGVGDIPRKNLLELRLPDPIPLKKGKFRGRIYVAEPSENLYSGIVVLLFHVKQDGNDELNAMQDNFINQAAERLPDTMHRLSRP